MDNLKRSRQARYLALFLCLLGCGMHTNSALANMGSVSAATLQTLITEVESSTDLPDQDRADLLARLEGGQQDLEQESLYIARREESQALIDGAKKSSARFRSLTDKSDTDSVGSDTPAIPDTDLTLLESQIVLLKAERKSLSERQSKLLQDLEQLPARRTAARDRLVQVQSEIERNRPALAVEAQGLKQRVIQVAAQARQRKLSAEAKSLETNILSEPARLEIGSAERAWLSTALGEAEARLALLTEAAEAARLIATQKELEKTAEMRAQLQSTDPALREFADTNLDLAEQLRSSDAQVDSARRDTQHMQSLLNYIEQESALMSRRLQAAGRKEDLGRVMVTLLTNLPDTKGLRRQMNRSSELSASISLATIDTEQALITFNREKIDMNLLSPDSSQDTGTAELVARLISQRQELLEANRKSLSGLSRDLLDNNDVASKLVRKTEEFHKTLMGNLLWVRNFSFISTEAISEQAAAVLSLGNWKPIPGNLVSGIKRHPWSIALLALLASTFLARFPLRRIYTALMTKPKPLAEESLWSIPAGLILSLALALPWPLAMYLAGYFSGFEEHNAPVPSAFSQAMSVTAFTFYILLLFRITIGKRGVGRRHLKWHAQRLDALRKELSWAGPLVLVAVFIDVFAFNLDVGASGGPMGVVAMAILAATTIAFGLRMLRKEVFSEETAVRAALQFIVALGALVIVMQLIGLLFAANMVLLGLEISILLILGVKLLTDTIERWLLIMRVRLKSRAREEQRIVQDEGLENADEDDEALDLASVSAAHQALSSLIRLASLTTGLWLIWTPILPAFELLDSVQLWQVAQGPDAAGALRSITLFNLGVGALILVITALVARHLPSLVQVFMLEWLDATASARHATSILLQYLVLAVGASMFLQTVGWQWSKVQWLVAALGVGIGFGLQEIVANFISGVIILFERPIRIGDIITVDGAEGTVMKINPRATILSTFENKEILVPNKQLITGQVVNWSLSANAVRVVITVGIAYGSDVRRALRILVETAQSHNGVLEEPGPRATFEDFGDNSLVLWLRCYIAEDRAQVWTELRTTINEKFEEEGIIISFPQRDIHLDMAEPLRIEINGRGEPVPF